VSPFAQHQFSEHPQSVSLCCSTFLCGVYRLKIVTYVVFVLFPKDAFSAFPLKYLSGSSIVIVARVKSCKIGGSLIWGGGGERLFVFRRSVCLGFFFAQDAVKNL
jgi:hypothetical protein